MSKIILDSQIYDNNKNDIEYILKLMKKNNENIENFRTYIKELETKLRYNALDLSLIEGNIEDYKNNAYFDASNLIKNIDKHKLSKYDLDIRNTFQKTNELNDILKKNSLHIKNTSTILQELKEITKLVNKFEHDNKKINVNLEIDKMSQKENFDRSIKSFSYSFDKLREINNFKIDKEIQKDHATNKQISSNDFHTNDSILSRYLGPTILNPQQRENIFANIYLNKIGGITTNTKQIKSALEQFRE